MAQTVKAGAGCQWAGLVGHQESLIINTVPNW